MHDAHRVAGKGIDLSADEVHAASIETPADLQTVVVMQRIGPAAVLREVYAGGRIAA